MPRSAGRAPSPRSTRRRGPRRAKGTRTRRPRREAPERPSDGQGIAPGRSAIAADHRLQPLGSVPLRPAISASDSGTRFTRAGMASNRWHCPLGNSCRPTERRTNGSLSRPSSTRACSRRSGDGSPRRSGSRPRSITVTSSGAIRRWRIAAFFTVSVIAWKCVVN